MKQHAGAWHVETHTDLVDDARAWLPEAHAILGTSSGKEVIHLLVDLLGVLQVSNATKALTARTYQHMLHTMSCFLFISADTYSMPSMSSRLMIHCNAD